MTFKLGRRLAGGLVVIWRSSTHTHYLSQPPPPAWLVAALERFKQEPAYANDHFEGTMRYTAIDSNTGMAATLPQPNQPVPPHIRFYFLPRIRCLDCPGKLYTPGPDISAANFEVHLKNKVHKEKVELRLTLANSTAGGTA